MRYIFRAQRLIERDEIHPLLVGQRPAKCLRREARKRFKLLRRGGFPVLLELVRPLLKDRALALEIFEQFLRLVLRHEADEERKIFVLRQRLLADEAVLFPEMI